jgi:glycosyltransferase involved in cell wall biosynthesis
MQTRISVIVPVFNCSQYTKLCLDSLADSGAEVIVVDNGSREKTRRLLESYGKSIVVVRNEENTGTAAALNQGASLAKNNCLMFLHNDCIVFKGWFSLALRVFDAMGASTIRACSPFTNYCDEGSFQRDPSLMNKFIQFKPSNKSRPTCEEITKVVEAT